MFASAGVKTRCDENVMPSNKRVKSKSMKVKNQEKLQEKERLEKALQQQRQRQQEEVQKLQLQQQQLQEQLLQHQRGQQKMEAYKQHLQKQQEEALRYHTTITESEWAIFNRQSGARVCYATRCGTDDPEFVRIASRFKACGDDVFETLHVWRVHHPTLIDAYEKERLAMELRSDDGSVVGEALHQLHTTQARLDVVLAEGLDMAKAKPGLFGTGIYTTDSPIKASSYWKIQFNRRIMLELSVLTGTTFESPLGETQRDLVAPPPGFDSVRGSVTKRDPDSKREPQMETVVYKNSQALIRYIIDYAVLPGYAPQANTILYGNPLGRLVQPTTNNQSASSCPSTVVGAIANSNPAISALVTVAKVEFLNAQAQCPDGATAQQKLAEKLSQYAIPF